MALSVVIPWRPGCRHREAAYAHIRHLYATHHPDWEVVEGRHDAGPWCKALAVADALVHTDADTLLIADADIWVPNLADAINRGPWVVPHGLVHRLDERSTAAVLTGGPMGGTTTERPYRGHVGGGAVLLSRSLYERAPLDARFQGWGQEDDAWGLALTRIAGKPVRLNHPLWHLWHPPQLRQTRHIGNDAGKALFTRYRLARSIEAMTALLEEARHGERETQPPGDARPPPLS